MAAGHLRPHVESFHAPTEIACIVSSQWQITWSNWTCPSSSQSLERR